MTVELREGKKEHTLAKKKTGEEKDSGREESMYKAQGWENKWWVGRTENMYLRNTRGRCDIHCKVNGRPKPRSRVGELGGEYFLIL